MGEAGAATPAIEMTARDEKRQSTAPRQGSRSDLPLDPLVWVNRSDDTGAVELPPPTRYPRRGDLNIAYQAFGEGPRALVCVPALPSHLDLMWTEAPYVRWLRRIGGAARLVIFDRPGLGLSDPVDHVPS